MTDRLVTAEINLTKLIHNLEKVRVVIGSQVKLLGVVKGNAYGHGIQRVGKVLEKEGINYLGVSCIYEARLLRNAQIQTPILLLGYTDPASVGEAIRLGCTITVIDKEVLKCVEVESKKRNKITSIHVKIDTGMHRLGISPKEVLSFISGISAYPHVFLEGVFTHFATADEKDLGFANEQLLKFREVITTLEQRGIHPPLIHAANSAAILRMKESHFSMVRAGKVLYGPLSLPNSLDTSKGSESILSLKTQIIQVRVIEKGESVGYGRAFVARKKMRIATLPIGYADGFRRSPTNFGHVIIEGKKASLIGRVSMDQSSIDVTKYTRVKVGDQVVVIGEQKGKKVTTQDVADQVGTISYEVLTALSERIERVYI